MTASADVLIVGGGAMGAGVAWMLKGELRHPGRVTVVERDPSYALAATTHTNSCIRQQFTTPLNIRLSQATLDTIADFPARTHGDGPAIATRFFGYLYLADTPARAAELREAQALQAVPRRRHPPA